MSAKIALKFDVLPEEKERLEAVCEALNIKKIDFFATSDCGS